MAMTDNKGNYITQHYNNYEKRASLASLETEQAKRKIREEILSADEVRSNSPKPSRKSSAKSHNNEKLPRRPGSIENEKKKTKIFAGFIEPSG